MAVRRLFQLLEPGPGVSNKDGLRYQVHYIHPLVGFALLMRYQICFGFEPPSALDAVPLT